jgi:hypothetical protein
MKEWAPHFWYVIEHILKETNELTLENSKLAISSIANFIPCQKCKTHFLEYIDKFPLDNVNIPELMSGIWLSNFKKSIEINKSVTENIIKPTSNGCKGCGKIKYTHTVKSSRYFKSGF